MFSAVANLTMEHCYKWSHPLSEDHIDVRDLVQAKTEYRNHIKLNGWLIHHSMRKLSRRINSLLWVSSYTHFVFTRIFHKSTGVGHMRWEWLRKTFGFDEAIDSASVLSEFSWYWSNPNRLHASLYVWNTHPLTVRKFANYVKIRMFTNSDSIYF